MGGMQRLASKSYITLFIYLLHDGSVEPLPVQGDLIVVVRFVLPVRRAHFKNV